MSGVVLSVKALDLTYPNGAHALAGVSVDICAGEFLALIGPNGSGKSSLLRCIAGLQAPDGGTVLINGKPVQSLTARDRAQLIAYLPQNFSALPGISAFDFVLTGRYARLDAWRLFSIHDRKVAERALESADALAFRDRALNEMSGGERQRVMLARALAQEAPVILLDEPTSAMDLKHQLQLCKFLRQIRGSAGKTIVAATHDLNLASQFADRMLLLRKGAVAAQGTPEETLNKSILENVYETELAHGYFAESADGRVRPWVLPWAKINGNSSAQRSKERR